ncbi:hypothetical protein NE237_001035 [Protea cynaroides]|uniref:Uncharacterized protein n=1 Tax=Protea cynaroides TaxID=273540 RepID=A0A9Q0QY20_9MAGN|nr:hypothetical protein NE237_001035 [Protea cynaroides]
MESNPISCDCRKREGCKPIWNLPTSKKGISRHGGLWNPGLLKHTPRSSRNPKEGRSKKGRSKIRWNGEPRPPEAHQQVSNELPLLSPSQGMKKSGEDREIVYRREDQTRKIEDTVEWGTAHKQGFVDLPLFSSRNALDEGKMRRSCFIGFLGELLELK